MGSMIPCYDCFSKDKTIDYGEFKPTSYPCCNCDSVKYKNHPTEQSLYKCSKEFETLTTGVVKKDTIWEYDPAYAGHSEVRLYATNENDNKEGYIDIIYPHFYSNFQKVE